MGRAFITGISGFVGSYLCQHLRENRWEVAGFDLHKPAFDGLFFEGDIRDRDKLTACLTRYAPDMVFHLAGQLKSGHPADFYEIHVMGTVTLFEALAAASMKPRVLVASSSAVYGRGLGGRPISEEFKCRPMTHYAVSKVGQEMVAMDYWRACGMPVVLMRTFNLLGPGLPQGMACADFTHQVALAEKSADPAVIETGNLDAQRDFVDVRDAVIAYDLLAQRGQPGRVYNICSGRMVSIRECLETLVSLSGAPLQTQIDPARLQASDVPAQVGSPRRIARRTGWQAKILHTQSLSDMLDHCRERLK